MTDTLNPREMDRKVTVPTHATDGTQVTFYIDVLGLAALAEAVTRADLHEQSLTLMAEIEPEHTQTAVLKVKIGQGTWSKGIGTCLVKRAHMYDNTLLDG